MDRPRRMRVVGTVGAAAIVLGLGGWVWATTVAPTRGTVGRLAFARNGQVIFAARPTDMKVSRSAVWHAAQQAARS